MRTTATIEHYLQSTQQSQSYSVQKYSKAFRTQLCIPGGHFAFLWWLTLARKANTDRSIFSRQPVVDLLTDSIFVDLEEGLPC